MVIREQGSPCLLCGAARKCEHSEPAPARQLRDPIPDQPGTPRGNAFAPVTGQHYCNRDGGRYSIPRSAKRDGPRAR